MNAPPSSEGGAFMSYPAPTLEHVSKLDPDTAIRIALIGGAERLYSERVEREHAIAQVRQTAQGRTDLLAEAAGHFLGMNTWSAPAQSTACLACHQLLVDAGGEIHPDIVEAAAARTRANLTNYGHTTAGTTAPGR